MPPPTESALLVALPEAEAIIGEQRAALDPSAPRGVPPHVTVLYPFVPPDRLDAGVVECLTETFAAVPEFDCSLTDVRWFGDTVVYLAPEPADAFRALTRLVAQRFPDYPPYRGAYTDLTPHVTVGQDAPVDVLQAAADAVRPGLPISTRATAVTLMTGGTESASWRVHAKFPLR
jgi:2'-5' RNA ligase